MRVEVAFVFLHVGEDLLQIRIQSPYLLGKAVVRDKFLRKPVRIRCRNMNASKRFLVLFEHIFSTDTALFKAAKRGVKVVIEHRIEIIVDIE